MDVADPEGCVSAGGFEYFFEVDAGEARAEAGDGNGDEANEVVAFRLSCGVGARGDLDAGDAEGEDEEGDPFCKGEGLAEEEHGEQGGSEDLALIGDLEGGGVEVGGSDELEVVLEGVEDSGDEEFEEARFCGEDVGAELMEGVFRGGAG